MEILESLFTVKHGSTTLISIGDLMWEPVAVNGRQAVQVVQKVRSSGIVAIPHGNETNELTFSLCVLDSDIENAGKTLLKFPIPLPRTMADVSVTISDGSGVKIKNAAVESWNGGWVEGIQRRTVRIVGGELETITAPGP